MQKRDSQLNDDILTLSEIAGYLKVSEKTILRLAQNGEIPGAKISNQWRFMRDVIDDWFTAKMQIAPKQNLIHVMDTGEKLLPLSRLTSPNNIILDIQPGSKTKILNQLVEPLVNSKIVLSHKSFVKSLLEREDAISTAIGHGVAIPHVRDTDEQNIASPSLTIGICKKGTDYASLDGEPTYLFILPCAPSQVIHFRLMAKISLMLRNTGIMDRFRAAAKQDDVMKILMDADTEIIVRL